MTSQGQGLGQDNNKFRLPILLYDSECQLCKRFKAALERLPGTDCFNMISLHQQEVYQHFPQIKKEECRETLHIITETEKVLKGADALQHLLIHFPGVAKFAWLIESDMGKKASNIFYDTLNHLRERLQKDCDTCKK